MQNNILRRSKKQLAHGIARRILYLICACVAKSLVGSRIALGRYNSWTLTYSNARKGGNNSETDGESEWSQRIVGAKFENKKMIMCYAKLSNSWGGWETKFCVRVWVRESAKDDILKEFKNQKYEKQEACILRCSDDRGDTYSHLEIGRASCRERV